MSSPGLCTAGAYSKGCPTAFPHHTAHAFGSGPVSVLRSVAALQNECLLRAVLSHCCCSSVFLQLCNCPRKSSPVIGCLGFCMCCVSDGRENIHAIKFSSYSALPLTTILRGITFLMKLLRCISIHLCLKDSFLPINLKV